MNRNSTYAFYGSLRRGMSNFDRYRDSLKYLFSVRLKGYRLFSKGEYPCAVEDGSDQSILVEVYKILNPEIEKEIHEMEMEEGYYFKNVMIDGQEVGLYLYDSAANYQEVKSGDWVNFFRRHSN